MYARRHSGNLAPKNVSPVTQTQGPSPLGFKTVCSWYFHGFLEASSCLVLPLQSLQRLLPAHDASVWVHRGQNAPGHTHTHSIIRGTKQTDLGPPTLSPPGAEGSALPGTSHYSFQYDVANKKLIPRILGHKAQNS